MANVLAHFDALTEHGVQVIPLRENSKVPLCRGWQRDWDHLECRDKLRLFPQSNIGVLLGSIIDVEGDTPHANRLILDLIGSYPHPTYSSTKSIHHLFQSPDPRLRICCHQGIEFRGHGHQSVLPPSQHQGVKYRWLRSFRFPIPEMPERLRCFYDQVSKKRKHYVKPGHQKIRCGECQKVQFLHRKRLYWELIAFRQWDSPWLCHDCRTVDLRPIVRRLRTTHRQ